jgi:hypothetical protein
MPSQFRTKLGFCDHTSLDVSTANLAAQQAFRLNSLYDPDYSGTGTQPTGFDELMAIYTRYRVLTAKVKVMVMSSLSSPIVEFACYPSISATPVSVTSPNRLVPIRYANFTVLGHSQPLATVEETVFSMADMFGVTRQAILDEQSYTGNASTNPSSAAYLHCEAMARTSSSQTVQLYVAIEFDVIFEELKALNES